MILGSCSALFGGSLNPDEIRATAYVIAATQLATSRLPATAEAVTASDPGLPTPTSDPIFCPPGEVLEWKAVMLVEVELLGIDFVAVMDHTSVQENFDEMITRIRTQSEALWQISSPRCGEKPIRRLRSVYDQLIITLEAIVSGDVNRISFEKSQLSPLFVQLTRSLKEVFPGEEYLEFEDLINYDEMFGGYREISRY